MNPEKIARKRFMMFSCSIISRDEHIKSRNESKNQKVFKSDFKEVLYSTAIIIYSQAYPSYSEPGNVYYCKVFFGLKGIHIGYSNMLSFVGIKKLANFFY